MKDLINHIAFVVDGSGSMYHLEQDVIKLFDSQIESLSKQLVLAGQETRVTVYIFNGETECVIFDKDVLRLPSLSSLYRATGSTNLIGSTIQAVADLKKTAQMYGDHAFLVYVLTDGQETDEARRASELQQVIRNMPDNWTLATFVPDRMCAVYAETYGFPRDNVILWDTSSKGIAAIHKLLDTSHKAFFTGRATGKRKFDGMFKLDLSNVSSRDVSDKLDALHNSKYYTLRVSRQGEIRNFVEANGLTYTKGCAFYQLTKPEVVQEYKEVLVRNKVSQRVYGGANARGVLGIPENTRIKLTPEMLGKFDVFIQSTSVNRKLVSGTDLIVML